MSWDFQKDIRFLSRLKPSVNGLFITGSSARLLKLAMAEYHPLTSFIMTYNDIPAGTLYLCDEGGLSRLRQNFMMSGAALAKLPGPDPQWQGIALIRGQFLRCLVLCSLELLRHAPEKIQPEETMFDTRVVANEQLLQFGLTAAPHLTPERKKAVRDSLYLFSASLLETARKQPAFTGEMIQNCREESGFTTVFTPAYFLRTLNAKTEATLIRSPETVATLMLAHHLWDRLSYQPGARVSGFCAPNSLS